MLKVVLHFQDPAISFKVCPTNKITTLKRTTLVIRLAAYLAEGRLLLAPAALDPSITQHA